jgi:hypothetical protein
MYCNLRVLVVWKSGLDVSRQPSGLIFVGRDIEEYPPMEMIVEGYSETLVTN